MTIKTGWFVGLCQVGKQSKKKPNKQNGIGFQSTKWNKYFAVLQPINVFWINITTNLKDKTFKSNHSKNVFVKSIKIATKKKREQFTKAIKFGAMFAHAKTRYPLFLVGKRENDWQKATKNNLFRGLNVEKSQNKKAREPFSTTNRLHQKQSIHNGRLFWVQTNHYKVTYINLDTQT